MHLWTHAHTGVFDREPDRLHLRRVVNQISPQFHNAFRRELDGVADQIAQHLHQAVLVGHQSDADAGVCHVTQVQPFAAGQCSIVVVDPREQVPNGHGLQHDLKLARLNFGVVQNIVNDAHHGATRIACDVQHLALISTQGGVGQQLQQTQEAAHGGANFMAHGGQKFILGLSGFLGCCFFDGQGMVGQLQCELIVSILVLSPKNNSHQNQQAQHRQQGQFIDVNGFIVGRLVGVSMPLQQAQLLVFNLR